MKECQPLRFCCKKRGLSHLLSAEPSNLVLTRAIWSDVSSCAATKAEKQSHEIDTKVIKARMTLVQRVELLRRSYGPRLVPCLSRYMLNLPSLRASCGSTSPFIVNQGPYVNLRQPSPCNKHDVLREPECGAESFHESQSSFMPWH